MYADTRHRVDEGRDRGDGPPARDPGAAQRRARHRADDDHQGHPRHQRPAARRGREHRRVLVGAADEATSRRPTRRRSRSSSPGWRPRCARRPRSSSSSGRRRSATRSSRSDCGSSSRTRRSSWRGPPSGRRKDALLRREGARGGAPAAAPRSPSGRLGARGHLGHRASPRARSRRTVDGVPRGATTGGAIAAELFPGIRDEHDDDGGWQARWLDRPTWDVTRDAQHPPPDGAASAVAPAPGVLRPAGRRAGPKRVILRTSSQSSGVGELTTSERSTGPVSVGPSFPVRQGRPHPLGATPTARAPTSRSSRSTRRPSSCCCSSATTRRGRSR